MKNRLINNLKNFPRIIRYYSKESTIHHDNNDDENETHYGFQRVKVNEKSQQVYGVFENVANKYDTMNDAMSFGIHRLWKDYFLYCLSPVNNTKLIDVAGGTGDIAFRFLNYVEKQKLSNCHVTVSDINKSMLNIGKKRNKFDEQLISWQEANAENLPFKDNQFNAYTISFGIRNCTHIDRVLQEAYRVLQPGGRFLCLEFSTVENPLFQWIYDQYSFQVIPVLGQIVAGQWDAYQYLIESIRQFPNQELFKSMIEKAGFRQVTYENLSLGIVAIHSGFKI